MSNYNRERFGTLTSRALALRQSEQRNYGCCWFSEGAEELCHWWKHGDMNL